MDLVFIVLNRELVVYLIEEGFVFLRVGFVVQSRLKTNDLYDIKLIKFYVLASYAEV